jgi:hypothetical protein
MAPKKTAKKKAKASISSQQRKKMRTTENTQLLLSDVLKQNGEAHLYDRTMALFSTAEDDPPIIFGWENVEGFVNAIIAAQHTIPPPPPPPFALPAFAGNPTNINVRNFKLALMNYARVPRAPAPFETSVLPCSLVQYSHSHAALTELNIHPWTQRIKAHGGPNILPLAVLSIPRPRSSIGAMDYAMPARPNSLWR